MAFDGVGDGATHWRKRYMPVHVKMETKSKRLLMGIWRMVWMSVGVPSWWYTWWTRWATLDQAYWWRRRSWKRGKHLREVCCLWEWTLVMAVWSWCRSPSQEGSDRRTMSSGRTSGMPPTLVETTSSPQLAASRMAMQKASVRLVLRKMLPCWSTEAT